MNEHLKKHTFEIIKPNYQPKTTITNKNQILDTSTSTSTRKNIDHLYHTTRKSNIILNKKYPTSAVHNNSTEKLDTQYSSSFKKNSFKIVSFRFQL